MLPVCLSLIGCACVGNHLRTFPLYSEVSIEHPDHVKLFEDFNIDYFVKDLPNSDVTKEYLRIDARVSDYLNKHNDIPADIATALKQHMIKRGMTQEQVVLLLGEPTAKKILKNYVEQWVYGKDKKFQWYYDWGKLWFERGLLTGIERKSIKIYK